MTLDQLSFFPSGDPSIANSRLLRPGDKRKMTTTGEEEEEKEDRMGGGLGSINASTIGTVETQRVVFVAFAIFHVFVVGHCYDRGVREY